MISFKKHDLHAGRLGRLRLELQRAPPFEQAIRVPRALNDLPLCLVPLTTPVTSIPSSFEDTPDLSADVEPKLGKKIERERYIRSTCAQEPHLAPAADLLSGLSQVSAAAADAEDATFANIISIGRTFDQRSRKSVGIIAVAAGTRGRLLRLNLLVEHPFASATANEADTYTTWKIAPGRSGWWNHRSTQIRQIEFSVDGPEYGQFLGIRFQASLALFRPVPRNEALRPVKNALVPGEEPMPASYIDPGFFAEVTAHELSGASFAYFAFDPSSQQIGAIDTFGNWAIWSFRYEHKTNPSFQSHPSLTVRGWLRGDLLARSNYDGWGRFLWSSDGSVFLAARRRNAAVYTTSGAGRPLRTPRVVNIRQEEFRDWIVDAKQCPLRPKSIWLLTSHRLVSISVTGPRSAEEQGSESKVEIDLSQLHFAQGEDVDLFLEIVKFPESLVAIIHGKTGSPLFTYTFRVSQTRQFHLVSINAGLIHFKQITRLGKRPQAANSPFVSSLAFTPITSSDDATKDVFPTSRVPSSTMIRLLYCSGDLSISETIVSLDIVRRSRPPLMQHIPRSRSTSVTSGKSVRDDFMVDDGMISDDPDEMLPYGSLPPVRIKLQCRPNCLHLSWFRTFFDEVTRGKIIGTNDTSSYRDEIEPRGSLIAEALEDASMGQSDLTVGPYIFLEAFGGISSEDFKELAGSFNGLLQNTFEPVHRIGDPGHSTALYTSLMNPCGLAWWPSPALIRGDASALFEQFHAITDRPRLVSNNGETRPSLVELARHLAMQTYLNLHKITVAAELGAVDIEDATNEDGAESSEKSHQTRNPDIGGPSSSSPPPLPESEDLFQGSGTSDLTPPANKPHPFAALASLAIISPEKKSLSNCDRLFDQWKEGELPTGHGLGLNLPSLMSNTPKAKDPKRTPREGPPANKVRIVDDDADAPSSPRAITIVPGSSQLPIRSQPSSSQVAVPSTLPRSSQFRSTQAFGSSQAGPSQSQKTKRRKAGF